MEILDRDGEATKTKEHKGKCTNNRKVVKQKREKNTIFNHMMPTETHIIQKKAHKGKMKQTKMRRHSTKAQKQVEVAIQFSDAEDIKLKLNRRVKSGHHILAKEKVQQEEIKILNI